MTGTPTRRATIRTAHDDPAAVARALRPDHTAEMETTVDSAGRLRTRIDRETTGGLHATVDDYLVNLDVAESVRDVTDPARPPADEQRADHPTDAGSASTTTPDNE